MPHSTYYTDLLGGQPKQAMGKSCLHPGSCWVGVQRSGRNSYDVKVKIDTVDIEKGTLAGTLEIRDLTPELDSLVTFFEGEIISESGPGFLTANYGASKEDDMRHWRRFPPFTRNRLEQQMSGPNLNLRGASKKPYIFMRWKERFVLPEHKIEAIHGASFAGLYYVCLDFEPASSDLFAEASPSLHRSISPPSARPFSFANPIPRRRPSQLNTPSQLAQTRPTLSPSLLQPPVAPPLPTPPITIERPILSPRSVSYAAALRGAAPSSLDSTSSSIAPSSISSLSNSLAQSHLSITPPTPSTTPPPELPTPKFEYESLPLSSTSSELPVSPVSSTAATSFLDMTQSPALANPNDERGFSSPPLVSSVEWPQPSPTLSQRSGFSPPSPTQDFIQDRAGANARRGRRRNQASEEEEEREDFGMKSWTEATLTGFYHFACSEPYQQLSLKYLPTTNGGSQEFSFC